MDDTKRQIIVECKKIVENHTGYVTETKENFKDQFTFKEVKDLLTKRKEAFDYKLIRMMQSYGYYERGLGNKLDKVWEGINVTQSNYKKYIRPLRYLFPLNFVVPFVDDTSLLKLQIWRDYTEKTQSIIKEILEER